MPYTAGVDVASTDLIDETEWNAYMGADGSLDTLKAIADKVPGCTQTRYTSATKALATDYRNTSGHARFVVVTLDIDTGTNPGCYAYIEANDTTPDVLVAQRYADNDTGDIEFTALAFMVPTGYYYKVSCATATIVTWVEWDFHG
jgi:hypothetical protein